MKTDFKKDMITRMNYRSESPKDTQDFARQEAQKFVEIQQDHALVVALEGDLGAGKTTFTQAFAQALGVHEKIKSPTFVLMKHYRLKHIKNYDLLYHLDCYRLQKAADLEPMGLDEILKNPRAFVLIEWAERVKEILPRNHWLIRFEHISEQERNISVTQK